MYDATHLPESPLVAAPANRPSNKYSRDITADSSTPFLLSIHAAAERYSCRFRTCFGVLRIILVLPPGRRQSLKYEHFRDAPYFPSSENSVGVIFLYTGSRQKAARRDIPP